MKFTSILGAAVLSLVTLFGAPQVNAATVTFEFDKATTGWADALNYSQSGLDLQVTGKTTNCGSARVATWTGSGLGLCNPIEGLLWCPGWKDQHAIDNVPVFGLTLLEDVAVLTFSKAVTLKKLTFNNLGRINSFDLSLGNGTWVDILTNEPQSGTWEAG